MSIVRRRSFLPTEGGYGGGGGGDEGRLKKTRGGAQPKGRHNCGGHRFTSGSVASFWPRGGQPLNSQLKGVSRLTGIFQRPAKRKHTRRRLKPVFLPLCPSGLRLHTANGITFHADLLSRVFSQEKLLTR